MKNSYRQFKTIVVAGASALLLILSAILTPAQAAPPSPRVVYENDFQGATLPGWSTVAMDFTPTGRRFLGQFGAEQVTFSLADLPAHTEVTLSFDFYAIRTWDGNQEFNDEGDVVGPDILDVTVDGGPTLWHTTFTNNGEQGEGPSQAYPGSHPGAENPAHSGAAEVNTLGYEFEGTEGYDSVYQLSATIPHSDNAFRVFFEGIGLQGGDDESWGLDNVKVKVDGTEIYFNDFDNNIGAEWAPWNTNTTPIGGRDFLGQFPAQTVSLRLGGLPSHSQVTLAFEFFAIQTWDGNQQFNDGGEEIGPDIVEVTISNGPTLLRTTFSNTENGSLPGGQEGPYPQAYPGSYSGPDTSPNNPPGTGASEIDTLGYEWDGDSVYQLNFTFDHTDSNIQINFRAEGIDDSESWGLDKIVVSVNQAPDCSAAMPSVGLIWPVNHKFVPITIQGVTDPNGDPVAITITGIRQDEPVNTTGDGSFVPDGRGLGTATAEVRAERVGSKQAPGNGRVYHIYFTADDGYGGLCQGEVRVGVPRDQGQGNMPIDEGPLYDSTIP